MDYAIVPINTKKVDNNLYIRCALIGYTSMDDNVYRGTRYLDCNPYLKDPTRALQYRFEDDGYVLVSDSYGNSDCLRMVKRPYRVCPSVPLMLIDRRLLGRRFVAPDDKAAISIFRESDYYNCDTRPMEVGKYE